ncbi:unnamed protein product [Heligmosomoides polygyrus]|uniref:BPTI/Kunitz inhibitor domain-containing protein n=1 Tax=Heligmosomoides polygyrus TaxID=6339 RepID=A0A3P7Y9J8_HELPZ|nr:unnamed protein product [Heligmosomoides polygyrus]
MYNNFLQMMTLFVFIACAELRLEYVKVCALSGQHKTDVKEDEFCQAFENICFRIPKHEPDQATVPSVVFHAPGEQQLRRNVIFRGIRSTRGGHLHEFQAVVFCPIYSERCHVPLPDRPVVPTRKPPAGRRTSAVERLCRSHRGFAEMYCNNPFTLSQPQYREGCEKYWRFCRRRSG